MLYVLLGFFGVCIGSFLNAWIWRTHEQHFTKHKNKRTELSVTKGRSMCTTCGHQLAAKDLIPVISWIMLRGKCRYCQAAISAQYPIVELATGAAFILSLLLWPMHLSGLAGIVQFVSWLFLLSVLIALTVFDLRYMLLPNRLVIWAAAPVLAWKLYDTLVVQRNVSVLIASLIGLAAFGGVFYVLFQVSDGKWIGGGDVKLGFVLGAWLADPILSLLAIFLASFIGTVYVSVLSLRRPIARSMKLPFGPLLIIGFVLSFLFGQQLISMYNDLLFRI